MFLTIDRYVIRTFLGGFLILAGVGMGMYVLLDLLFNLDEFSGNGELPFTATVAAILDYYIYNLPLYFSQIAAPVMAISAAFTLGLIMRNNEMTALVAAGMPLQRLAIPIAWGVAFLLPVIMFNREYIIPSIAAKVARQRDDASGTHLRSVRCVRAVDGAVLTAPRLDVLAGRMEGVYFLLPPAADLHSQDLIQADAAQWDAQDRLWRLERGTKTRIAAGGDGGVDIQPIGVLPFTLAPEELLLRQSAEWSDLLSTPQLKRLARPGLPNYQAMVQSLILRITEPLSHLVLLALAIPAFLSRERHNVITAGSRALVWTAAFFAFTFVMRELVSDVQGAKLAAGLPIIVFGPLAFMQLLNVKT